MKKALLILIVTGFFITCKKDKSPSTPRETVLSKIFFDNILVYDFVYSPQRQLTRINSYNEKTGKFEYASSFEYDAEGRAVKENQYTSTNKLDGQVLYKYTGGGKLSLQEYKPLSGNDSGHVTVRIKYSYDGAGRISQRAWVNLVTDLMEASTDFTYYSNGNLKSSSSYYYYTGAELKWKTDYSDGKEIPPSLLKYQGYPVNFLFFDMVTGEKHFYEYNNGLVSYESKEVFTDRKYDNAGFLTQQTITQLYILPVKPKKEVVAKYEYIQL